MVHCLLASLWGCRRKPLQTVGWLCSNRYPASPAPLTGLLINWEAALQCYATETYLWNHWQITDCISYVSFCYDKPSGKSNLKSALFGLPVQESSLLFGERPWDGGLGRLVTLCLHVCSCLTHSILFGPGPQPLVWSHSRWRWILALQLTESRQFHARQLT